MLNRTVVGSSRGPIVPQTESFVVSFGPAMNRYFVCILASKPYGTLNIGVTTHRHIPASVMNYAAGRLPRVALTSPQHAFILTRIVAFCGTRPRMFVSKT